MALKIDEYRNIAQSLLERDTELHKRFTAYEDMFNLRWKKPASLQAMDWVIERIDSTPRDVVVAGIRAYAALQPNLNLTKPGQNEETRRRYNQMETVLKWQYEQASRRAKPITAEILKSALLFDQVAVRVVHVQAYLDKLGNIPEARRRAIRKYGNYVIQVHSPRSVHVRRSDMGVEGVLSKKVMTLAEFAVNWGDKAKPITSKSADKGQNDNKFVVEWEWTDHQTRAVWADLTDQLSVPDSPSGTKILVEDHDLPSLPWIIEGDGAQPMLYGLYKTKEWEKKNVEDTLLHSEVVARSAAPRYQLEGPTGEIEIVYGDPSTIAKVPPGHKLTPMPPPMLDQSLLELSNRSEMRISQSTAPLRVLTGQMVGGNVAFASMNQAYESGLMTYAPARRLAERALEKVFCQMLYLADYHQEPIPGPLADFAIAPDTIDYDIEAQVKLTADMPVDRLAQVNTGAIAKRELNWSSMRVNEMLGVNDPETMERERTLEVYRQQEVENRRQLIEAEGQMNAQIVLAGQQAVLAMLSDPVGMQMLQQAQQQWQAMLQQMQQGGEGGMPPGDMGMGMPPDMGAGPGSMPPMPGGAPGLNGIEGQGFDPAMGGTPPAMAAPFATREQQTGFDRTGGQLA